MNIEETKPEADDEPPVPDTLEQLIREYDRMTIIGQRWIACWIDFFAMLVFLLLLDYSLGNELYRRLLPVWLLALALYFPVCEGIWGYTLGKLIGRVRVIDETGAPPGFAKALVRTLTRLIEVNPVLVGGVPAGIVVALSRRRRRFGDMLAKTDVVDAVALRTFLADGRRGLR